MVGPVTITATSERKSASTIALAFHMMSMTAPKGEIVEDIYAMDRIGTNMKRLTIAFTQSRGTAGPGRGSIWTMRGDGSDKRQVTLHPGNGFDLNRSWSPDGIGMRLRTTSPAWGGGVAPAWIPAQR